MEIINKNIDSLTMLCQQYKVDKLYIFGSILSPAFNTESDIDFLVKFKDISLFSYFDNYINFKTELQLLLKHDIDLIEEQTVKNPILKKSIENSKELIYG